MLGCHCWVPLREKIDQSVTPFSAASFSTLITHKLTCAIWGLCWYNLCFLGWLFVLPNSERSRTPWFFASSVNCSNVADWFFNVLPWCHQPYCHGDDRSRRLPWCRPRMGWTIGNGPLLSYYIYSSHGCLRPSGNILLIQLSSRLSLADASRPDIRITSSSFCS